MSALAPLAIRLLCDLAARGQTPTDLNTSQPPQFYRGDDVEIDIGIGQAGALLAPTLTNVASVTCQIFARQNDTNAPMMASTVVSANMNLGLTAAEWTGQTSPFYHAAFLFPNSQTYVPLSGQASQNCWLRIFLTTADAPTPKIVTLLEGAITVLDGPVNTASPPATGKARTFTVGGETVWQIQNDSDGHYYTIGCADVDGVPSLYVGTTPY
jgi:hypothetical protein